MEKKKFICSVCNKEYTRFDAYERHMLTHEKNTEIQSTPASDLKDELFDEDEELTNENTNSYSNHLFDVEETVIEEENYHVIQNYNKVKTIDDEIIDFFESLKTPKMTSGFRIRRNLTESEIIKLYDLHNRKFNTKHKKCNVCSSLTAKMYEKLKKVYDNDQENR